MMRALVRAIAEGSAPSDVGIVPFCAAEFARQVDNLEQGFIGLISSADGRHGAAVFNLTTGNSGCADAWLWDPAALRAIGEPLLFSPGLEHDQFYAVLGYAGDRLLVVTSAEILARDPEGEVEEIADDGDPFAAVISGEWAVFRCYDELRRFNLESGEVDCTLTLPERHPDFDMDPALAPVGGDRLAAPVNGTGVLLVDAATLSVICSLSVDQDDAFGPCAASPDGRWLAIDVGEGRVAIWDLASGGEPRTLRHKSRDVSAILVEEDVLVTGHGGKVCFTALPGAAELGDLGQVDVRAKDERVTALSREVYKSEARKLFQGLERSARVIALDYREGGLTAATSSGRVVRWRIHPVDGGGPARASRTVRSSG